MAIRKIIKMNAGGQYTPQHVTSHMAVAGVTSLWQIVIDHSKIILLTWSCLCGSPLIICIVFLTVGGGGVVGGSGEKQGIKLLWPCYCTECMNNIMASLYLNV